MQILRILALFMLFASFCSAAYVYGDIYTPDFEKLNETVVKIDGSFSYQLVTEKANYSIFLPEGEYTISASSYDEHGNTVFYAQETVNVGEQDQRVDFVLMPVNNNIVYLGFLVLIIVAIFLIDSRFRPRKMPVEAKPPRKTELDEDAKKVLQVLEGFEKRATQKELKEALKFSDAKLSLILTELEHLGHIKKFKRGRANIVKKLN